MERGEEPPQPLPPLSSALPPLSLPLQLPVQVGCRAAGDVCPSERQVPQRLRAHGRGWAGGSRADGLEHMELYIYKMKSSPDYMLEHAFTQYYMPLILDYFLDYMLIT